MILNRLKRNDDPNSCQITQCCRLQNMFGQNDDPRVCLNT